MDLFSHSKPSLQNVVKGSRVSKSERAYLSISEVAKDLEVATHVLRFWEGKFKQIKPMKRAGGRRYYGPQDIALLRSIRSLLYDEGYTIKGVQTYLRKHTKDEIKSVAAPAASVQILTELQSIRDLLEG